MNIQGKNKWLLQFGCFCLLTILVIYSLGGVKDSSPCGNIRFQKKLTQLQSNYGQLGDFNQQAHISKQPGRMSHEAQWANRNALHGDGSTRMDRSSKLLKVIFTSCKDSRYRVPNVVHYIWFGCTREFNFYHFMSVITTRANIDPCAIIFHADCEPNSRWWKIAVEHVDSLYMVYREAPVTVFGEEISFIEHKSDVARMRILIEWGGIYFDDTVLGISSLDPLRNYSSAISIEDASEELLTNSIIVAEPNSPYVKEWYNGSYHDYQPRNFNYNSGCYSFRLWKHRPDLGLFVEMKKFLPKWDECIKVWQENYPWRNNYAIHFVVHDIKKLQRLKKLKTPSFPDDVYTMNSAFGEICRLALKKINITFS